MNKLDSILFMGPPCSMKTLAGQTLSSRYDNFFHISTGEVLRNINPNNRFHSLVQEALFVKRIIPLPIMQTILNSTIQQKIKKKLYSPDTQTLILDGFPRNSEQLEFAQERFNIEKVIVFELGDEEIFRRYSIRKKNQKRIDDNGLDVLRKSLEDYKVHTLPLIDLIDPEIICRINAYGGIYEVYDRVESASMSCLVF